MWTSVFFWFTQLPQRQPNIVGEWKKHLCVWLHIKVNKCKHVSCNKKQVCSRMGVTSGQQRRGIGHMSNYVPDKVQANTAGIINLFQNFDGSPIWRESYRYEGSSEMPFHMTVETIRREQKDKNKKVPRLTLIKVLSLLLMEVWEDFPASSEAERGGKKNSFTWAWKALTACTGA